MRQTGQELLLEALRVLAPDVVGFAVALEHFDLSLANRRETANAVVLEAAARMRETKLGLKAATITPEAAGDVGSPNAILRKPPNETEAALRASRSEIAPPPSTARWSTSRRW